MTITDYRDVADLSAMAASLLGLLALLYVAVRGWRREHNAERRIERDIGPGFRRVNRGWVRTSTGEQR